MVQIGELGLIELDIVQQVLEKVKVNKDRLKMTHSRQKSYTYVMRRPLEFEVRNWVYPKFLLLKGVMRFGKNGKLSLQYIGPYRISMRIVNVYYKLELPQELTTVHFHLSILKKCMADPLFIVPTKNVGIKYSLSYEEILVKILAHQFSS